MSAPWHMQKLSEPPLDVLRRVRQSLRSGEFSRASLDHNHPNYRSGLSNKQFKILGAILLGWNDSEYAPTYDQCYGAVMEAITGLKEDD